MAILIRQTQSVMFGSLNFGTVNEVQMEIKPVTVGRDSLGRTRIAGYDVKITFNVMDCDRDAINNLLTIRSPGTLEIHFDEIGEQFYLLNVCPNIEVLQIDGDGKPSKIKVTADKIVNESEVKSLLTDM